MKLLFAYSDNFKKDEYGNYYTGGSADEEMWERYANITDELNIISRIDKSIYRMEYAKKYFNTFDGTNKNFIPIPRFQPSVAELFNIRKYIKAKRTIQKSVINIDFVIARVPSVIGNIAIKYAKKYKKPYLVEVVGCPWDAYWNHSFKGKLVAPFMYYSTKKVVKGAEYAIYVTNEFLQRRYPSVGKTLGCSDVSLPPLDENILRRRLNKINQMSGNKPIVIGTVAAVNVRYKGQQYVISAISKLNREGYNFEYHLVGGGDDSYLRSIAKKFNVEDKVKFLGSLPHEEVFRYLDNIDIYIQPSKTEGLPRAVVEAMSRACPCIGSNAGGMSELFGSNFIFPKGSVKEICRLLKMMNKEIMLEEAKRSFNKAKEYDKELLDRKRNKFYNSFSRELRG